MGKRKSFSDIPNEFVSNDKVLSGSLDIANGSDYSEIVPNIAKQIPKSKNHYSSFLSNPCSEQFVFGNVKPTTIAEALGKLKSKTVLGWIKSQVVNLRLCLKTGTVYH